MFQYNTVTSHSMCYLYIVQYHRRIFLTLFIWCNYWFVLTYSTSVHILSLPSCPLHAVPSYLLLTSCLLQWFQAILTVWVVAEQQSVWVSAGCGSPANAGKDQPPWVAAPDSVFSFPKGFQMSAFPLEFVSIECKCSILGLSNSLTNSALWAMLFFKLMSSVIEGNLEPIIQKHWASVSPARS